MKYVKTFERFQVNEEINLKGIAAGAMMALMTACHNGEINGEPSEGYNGDMLVKRIEMGGGKRNYFLVHGLDKEGNPRFYREKKYSLKTGMYYLRNKAKTDAVKFTNQSEKEVKSVEEQMAEISCSLDSPDDCIACGS